MFRSLLFLTTSLCALPALAEDFTVIAPVKAVTVYPVGATLTRGFSVDLPAGLHRILMPVPAEIASEGLPRIEGLGALSVGSLEYLPGYVTDADTLRSPAQRAAADLVELARDRVQAAQDAVAQSDAEIGGISTQISYLQAIASEPPVSADAAEMLAVSKMIAEESAKAYVAQQAAIEGARGLKTTLDAAQKGLAQAQQDLARLTPPSGPVDMLAITVAVPEATAADLSLNHLIRGAAWRATYDMDLDRDTGVVALERKVIVQQRTGELWSDVALTLSTADPFAQVTPSQLFPNLAQIAAPRNGGVISSTSRLHAPESFDASGVALEAAPVLEEVTAGVVLDGLSVTYDYPQAVSVATGGGALVLALDGFAFDAEVFNRAVPRIDKTAFLMARFTNDQPEPILQGEASLYRDGSFVGRMMLSTVPAGAETLISFGGIEGLQLDFTMLNNDTGDRGLLSTSSTRRQMMEFTVQNLTTEPEQVEALFALPFTEQEDLSLRVNARPAPDKNDLEKLRGVSAWDLEVGPGETKTVTLDVNLSWPEGSQLIWRP